MQKYYHVISKELGGLSYFIKNKKDYESYTSNNMMTSPMWSFHFLNWNTVDIQCYIGSENNLVIQQ